MTGKWRRWTEAEDARLLALRARGDNWDDIARQLGRASGSCQQRFNKRKPAGMPRKPTARRIHPPMPPMPPVRLPGLPVVQAQPGPPSARRVSTHVLIADAELRARIAVQGLTAGLLGDPPAGRSALDQRNARQLGGACADG